MASKFNRNAILSGYIDAFCLVCEVSVDNKEDIESHIGLQEHINNLKSTQLVERFRDDQILKVNKGYYCIICNLLFTTLTKVGLHTIEKEHKATKGVNMLNRAGSVVTFGDIVIDERAWQGLVGDMCAVCNAEFEDETKHLTDPMHALNLVKNKVEFDDKQIIRKIDDTAFQCITCNTVLLSSDIVTHFDDIEHHKNLLKCKKKHKLEKIQKLPIKNHTESNRIIVYVTSSSSSSEGFDSAEGSGDESSTSVEDVPSPNKADDISNILDSVSVFAKNEVNVNFVNETALCKKCLGNINFEFKSIKSHIEEHIRNPTKRNSGYVPFPCEADMRMHRRKSNETHFRFAIAPAVYKTSESKNELGFDSNHNEVQKKATSDCRDANKKGKAPLNESPADFAKRNKLTYNYGHHNAYCRLCETRVPASLLCMKEHVEGKAHRNKVPNKTAGAKFSPSSFASFGSPHQPIIRKMATEDYLDEVFTIESLFLGSIKIVNDKFCIGNSSFYLITVNGDSLRCQVCELNLNRWDMTSHVKSFCHERLFIKVPVIWTFRSEFVREVRTGIFHCGFCNIMESGLEALETHFQSVEHKTKREAASANLARHRPALESYKEQRRAAFFLEMIFGRMYRRI